MRWIPRKECSSCLVCTKIRFRMQGTWKSVLYVLPPSKPTTKSFWPHSLWIPASRSLSALAASYLITTWSYLDPDPHRQDLTSKHFTNAPFGFPLSGYVGMQPPPLYWCHELRTSHILKFLKVFGNRLTLDVPLWDHCRGAVMHSFSTLLPWTFGVLGTDSIQRHMDPLQTASEQLSFRCTESIIFRWAARLRS